MENRPSRCCKKERLVQHDLPTLPVPSTNSQGARHFCAKMNFAREVPHDAERNGAGKLDWFMGTIRPQRAKRKKACADMRRLRALIAEFDRMGS
jgi:hypothetical protein